MRNIVVGLTTYDRAREYERTIERLRETMQGHKVTVVVVQDGGKDRYVHDLSERGGFRVIARTQRHFGKKRYWKTVNHVWQLARTYGRGMFVYVQLPDDFHYDDKWLEYALRYLDQVGDRAAVNLLKCHRIRLDNWGFRPQRSRGDLYKNGFIDGAFLCTERVLEELDWTVKRINPHYWNKRPKAGSQVWKQVSHRLKDAGIPMYITGRAILETDWSAQKSKMNRNRTPIHT